MKKLVLYDDTTHDFEAVNPQQAVSVAVPTFRMVANMPPFGALIGESIINTTTNQAYVWDGANWVDITPRAITMYPTEAALRASTVVAGQAGYAMAADTGGLFMLTSGGQWKPVGPMVYQTEAALLLDTPSDGIVAYAVDKRTVWYRVNSTWAPGTVKTDTGFNILSSRSYQGQLAVSTDYAGLFMADGAGGWQQIPWSTFVSESVLLASTPPDGAVAIAGDTKQLFVRDGGIWHRSSAPLVIMGQHTGTADAGMLNYHTQNGPDRLRLYDGAHWQTPTTMVVIKNAAYPPTGHEDGDMMWRTDRNQMYVKSGNAWWPLNYDARAGRYFEHRNLIMDHEQAITNGYSRVFALDPNFCTRYEFELITRGQSFGIGTKAGMWGKGTAHYAINTVDSLSFRTNPNAFMANTGRGSTVLEGWLEVMPGEAWLGRMSGMHSEGNDMGNAEHHTRWWNFNMTIGVDQRVNEWGFCSHPNESGQYRLRVTAVSSHLV